MKEHSIQDNIRIGLCEQTNGVVFRTNAGVAWAGDKIIDTPEYGRVLVNPRKVTLLPEGFSDLLYVGDNATVAFIECKTPKGKAREAQERFIKLMRSLGHRAGIARNVEQALKIVKGENDG